MTELTPAQQRHLEEIRKAGPEGCTYYGRSTRTLGALERAGLIRVEWHVRPSTRRKSEQVWVLTAVAVDR